MNHNEIREEAKELDKEIHEALNKMKPEDRVHENPEDYKVVEDEELEMNKELGDPSINNYSSEEILVDKTTPYLKQKISALYILLKPEVDEFYSDPKKLHKKFDSLYIKYTKLLNGCQNDIKKANENLDKLKIQLAKAEKEFQQHNEKEFDPASWDQIVAPTADLVDLWTKFTTMKSKELNRYRFLKTKIFAKEKNVAQFIKHATTVHVIMMCLKENNYKNPFDPNSENESDRVNYNKVEELRRDFLESEEYKHLPEEISDEFVEDTIRKYATSYLTRKKESALQHRDMADRLLDDAYEKYTGQTAVPELPEGDITEAQANEVITIFRKNKVKTLRAKLQNSNEISDDKEREYLKDILNYAEFWCNNEGVELVVGTTDQLEPFVYNQLVSVYKRQIKSLAPVVFADEPINKAEMKFLMSFICTTLSDSIALCIGLL